MHPAHPHIGSTSRCVAYYAGSISAMVYQLDASAVANAWASSAERKVRIQYTS